MFCPECGAEYREGVTGCADCNVGLVEQLPSEPKIGWRELITVLETADENLVVVAKGILEGAGIPYLAKADRLQDLIGWGRFGSGFNIIVGPIQIQVPEEYVEAARALLAQVPESGEGDA